MGLGVGGLGLGIGGLGLGVGGWTEGVEWRLVCFSFNCYFLSQVLKVGYALTTLRVFTKHLFF